jgi:hypothetical protein
VLPGWQVPAASQHPLLQVCWLQVCVPPASVPPPDPDPLLDPPPRQMPSRHTPLQFVQVGAGVLPDPLLLPDEPEEPDDPDEDVAQDPSEQV